MSKQVISSTTTATVTVTLKLDVGSWGPGCTLEQVYRQAAGEAEGRVRCALADRGCYVREVKAIEVLAMSTVAQQKG